MKKFTKLALPALLVAMSLQSYASSSVSQIQHAFPTLDVFNPAGDQVAQMKQQLARQLAKQLPNISAKVQARMSMYRLQLPLSTELVSGNLSTQLQSATKYTRTLKGLPSSSDSLYQLRLADQAMLERWQHGEEALVAFAPKGDDKTWLHVQAYDKNGNVHLLDAHTLPKQPVLVVEIDGRKSVKEGLAVMQSEFNKRLGTSSPQQIDTQSDAGPISTSVLKRIRLNDDEEPWISGAAEVYGVVTGVNPSRDEPVLDIVDMPYLDHDGRDYNPNQIVIYWDRYRWQAADMLLMEQDDNTNYQTLATTFLDIVTQVMRTIPDPNVQGYAIIPQLTNQLIKAMPSSWFTNDDDYVDVFYTLFEGQQYTGYMGASGNAKISLSPLTINPR
ncbi:hypothetical protein PSECIP111951_03402 [Pseudoalteromonas holothuriae]|uniref:DUF3103 domain-containing protein n=1 Tax=Pseudoalteromonas holothuriae TaxID=2963714 RepID=A0A9W4R347_9GAMM|nr:MULTISPECIES: DUF3103 domain-containing protein [unclassified Pseudoalteromonas]CAH9064627.1 hypothetical protein PSECIP111854_03498 [Pseudoalteromonas sp. CIP111854]CAH9065623.1 hypothetical protein PSECIP111951_03402 [Pseudoalteromonas sp. CIP111951]